MNLEEALREIERREELISGADHRNRELEAQCAAQLEWKESAMRALAEWHEARELIGRAQIGDGPIGWAKRVLERLVKADTNVGLAQDAANFATLRAEQAERQVDALREELNFPNKLVLSLRKEGRAQAFEEAAKVAAETIAKHMGAGWDAVLYGVPEAIRALKERT